MPNSILLHDYSGHPFQVQLSRTLADRGIEVCHQFSAQFQTPKGALSVSKDDPQCFSVEPIRLDEDFQKYSFVKRRSQEIEYGKRLIERLDRLDPQCVIASNIPLDPLSALISKCKVDNRFSVVWLQDIYSIAMAKLLPKKLPFAGSIIARYYQKIERRVLNDCDAIVAITDDFVPVLDSWGVDTTKVSIVENWAPKNEIVPMPQINNWSKEHGLAGKKVVLYSGTLSMKHDPSVIVDLCKKIDHLRDVVVVVVSEGSGASYLERACLEQNLGNLMLLPFQAYERFSEVLAAASILIAFIEKEAGSFSVPSKVLSYLCAARPIVLAVPEENLAAKTIMRSQSGHVVAPGDGAAFANTIDALIGDDEGMAQLGRNGRAHADRMFDIDVIADRFETIIAGGTKEARIAA